MFSAQVAQTVSLTQDLSHRAAMMVTGLTIASLGASLCFDINEDPHMLTRNTETSLSTKMCAMGASFAGLSMFSAHSGISKLLNEMPLWPLSIMFLLYPFGEREIITLAALSHLFLSGPLRKIKMPHVPYISAYIMHTLFGLSAMCFIGSMYPLLGWINELPEFEFSAHFRPWCLGYISSFICAGFGQMMWQSKTKCVAVAEKKQNTSLSISAKRRLRRKRAVQQMQNTI